MLCDVFIFFIFIIIVAIFISKLTIIIRSNTLNKILISVGLMELNGFHTPGVPG